MFSLANKYKIIQFENWENQQILRIIDLMTFDSTVSFRRREMTNLFDISENRFSSFIEKLHSSQFILIFFFSISSKELVVLSISWNSESISVCLKCCRCFLLQNEDSQHYQQKETVRCEKVKCHDGFRESSIFFSYPLHFKIQIKFWIFLCWYEKFWIRISRLECDLEEGKFWIKVKSFLRMCVCCELWIRRDKIFAHENISFPSNWPKLTSASHVIWNQLKKWCGRFSAQIDTWLVKKVLRILLVSPPSRNFYPCQSS